MNQWDKTFDLIMERFDRLEVLLDAHIVDDKKVHAMVKTHEVYWTIVKAVCVPGLLGLVSWIWMKLHP